MKSALDINEYISIEYEYMAYAPKSITLQHEYDHNQLWLDFGHTIFYPIKKSYLRSYYRDNIRPSQTTARIRPLTYIMYSYSNNQQYQLRFDEFCQISDTEYYDLKRCDYPCWDRDDDDNIYQMTINIGADYMLFKYWFVVNASGRYYINTHNKTKQNDVIIMFSRRETYMMVQLLERSGVLKKVLSEYCTTTEID